MISGTYKARKAEIVPEPKEKVAFTKKKILIVCTEGNNRSVTVAGILKYVGHDTLTAGLNRNKEETLEMLYDWADLIIRTNDDQIIPDTYQEKVKTLLLGPDTYPRPFNKELYAKVKQLLKENERWFI